MEYDALDAWYLEARKSPKWNFHLAVDQDSFQNVRKIHPLKQRPVKATVAEAKKHPFVKRIIVFGSSITYRCYLGSDLDLCIEWTEPATMEDGTYKPFARAFLKEISFLSEGGADVLNYEELGDYKIKDDVLKGVTVYECPVRHTQ